MSGSLGDLIARVGANIDGYVSAMDTVVSTASKTVDQVEKRFESFGNLGASIATIGAGLTAGLTAPIVGLGAAATSTYSEFEYAMNRVSAVGDVTGQSLKKLEQFAMQMGAQTKFSATEAAQGMGELAAKGYNVEQIMTSLPGTLALAATENMTVAEASKIASSAIAQFGLQVSQTGHIADVFAKASADSASSVATLGLGMEYVGPVAKSAGLSFEATTAALALLSNAGLEGEKAGTGLRGAIGALINPSKDAQKSLDELGIKTTTVGGAMRPLSDIMEELRSRGATTTQMFNIFGKEAASAAIVLRDQGAAGLNTMTESLLKSAGAAEKMAGIMNSGIKGSFERLSGSVETAGIALGKILEPALVAVAGAAEVVANKISELVQWFGALPAPIQAAVGTIVALTAAAGPAALAIGGIGLAISTIGPPLAAIAGFFSVSVGALLGWAAAIGVVVAALVGLGTWIYQNWTPIVAVLQQAWSGLSDIWHAAWDPISSWLSGLWTSIATTAASIWAPIGRFLGTIWDAVGPYFTSVWNGIGTLLDKIWGGIKTTADTVWNGVVKALQEFLSWAAKIPGVNKLFNLDEAWTNAQKLADKTKGATTEVKAHTEAQKKVAPAIAATTTEVDKHGKAAKEATQHFSKFTQQQANHLIKMSELRKAYSQATEEMDLLTAEIQSGKGPLEALMHALDGVKFSVDRLTPDMEVFKNVIDSVAGAAASAANDVGEAFRRLGVASSIELGKTAAQAKRDYETIANSGIATKGEIEAAWVAMTKAEIQYRKSLGEDVTALEAELAKYENAHKNHQARVKSIWQQISEDISHAFDRAAMGLSDALRDVLTGDFSIDKVADAFENLGLDIASAFLDVGAKAIMNFIKVHIGALLEALGKVLEKIPGIGTALGGVFDKVGGTIGGSGGATPTPPTVPTTGAGGAIGAGASSIAGWLTAGASIASAITGVIGVFQSAQQEKTLNAIEESTRYSKAYNLLGVTLALQYWPQIEGIHNFLWTAGITVWTDSLSQLERIAEWSINNFRIGEDIRARLDTIQMYAIGTFELIRDEIVTRLQDVSQIAPEFAMAGAGPLPRGGMSVSFDLRGATISDNATVDRLMRRVTDEIRRVTR